MEDCQLTFTMHATLLATLVALSHRGPLGLSSAQDGSHVCCTELEMLAKEFPEEAYEGLMDDCLEWLVELRASRSEPHTECPIPETSICEKFDCQKRNNATTVAVRDWQKNEHVTVRNILRVVDSQNWHNCVIVYEFLSWPMLDLLASSLSERHVDFIVYDVVNMNDRSDLMDMMKEVFTVLNMRNVIVMSNVTFSQILFREAEDYDKSLGRTSGLRMLTRWIVTTSGGLKDEVARASTYFDNVVAIIESQELITTNASASLDIFVIAWG